MTTTLNESTKLLHLAQHYILSPEFATDEMRANLAKDIEAYFNGPESVPAAPQVAAPAMHPRAILAYIVAAMELDNGGSHPYGEAEYLEARPYLLELREVGYFADSPHDLDGSFWHAAGAHDEEDTDAFFGKSLGAYVGLGPVLKRIFDGSAAPAPVDGGAAPAGYQLVPVEPTIEMLNAGDMERQDWHQKSPVHVGRRISASVYRSMLAAAPVDGSAAGVPLVVTTAPKRIWLDLGFDPELEAPTNFRDLHDATWSEDNASDFGVEYVRADLAALVAAPASTNKADARPSIPEGWRLVKQSRLDEIARLSVDHPDGPMRNEAPWGGDGRRVYKNWSRASGQLDSIQAEVEAMEEDAKELQDADRSARAGAPSASGEAAS